MMKLLLPILIVLTHLPGYTQNLVVRLDRSLQIGNPVDSFAPAGVLRWSGINFEVTDGESWYLLTEPKFGSVTDIDGNVYLTAYIGSRQWMLENLRTTRFKDGTPIQLSSSSSDWGLAVSSYCWVNNDPNSNLKYGKLYNGYTATNSRGLCPAGWQVPFYGDWSDLALDLGGQNFCGGKLKEMGHSHWQSNNAEATNESGFTALGAGLRAGNGDFVNLKLIGYWWASNGSGQDVYYANLYHYNGRLDINLADKLNGLSVRCVR
jgi:uncharacterized protein (TIGR02145 family)